jgi:hypothetical protein
MASEWLSKNTHNRRIRVSWVKELTRRILCGLWELTNQGIAFDPHGLLVDGQHRLLAIVASGKTVPVWVFTDVPLEVQLAVDDHGKRTPFDSISLSDIDWGCELKEKHVAAARTMMNPTGQSSARFSNQELRDFMQTHIMAIRAAVALFERKSTKARITTATVMAVIARAFYHVPLHRLQEFADILYNGVCSEERDSAAIRLRDVLLAGNGTGGGTWKRDIYQRVERALEAFIDGRKLAKLYAAKEELFPLPEEQGK